MVAKLVNVCAGPHGLQMRQPQPAQAAWLHLRFHGPCSAPVGCRLMFLHHYNVIFQLGVT